MRLANKFESKIVEIPIVEQIQELIGPHEAAVLLIPNGDNGLKTLHRGTGGAWWTMEFNEPGHSVNLAMELRDVTEVMLIRRRDVDDALLSPPPD